MHKTLAAIVLLLAFGASVFFWGEKSEKSVIADLQKKRATSQSAQLSPETQNAPTTPTKLVIDKLGIDTPVESVGLDSQGRMDVPKNVQQVGWYNLGYKPGQKGSAVLSGHFDTETGAPAVFYRLEELVVGDKIVVYDEENKEYIFTVNDKKTFPYDKLPLNEIFASQGEAQLNLITCAGAWDKDAKNYSNRTVIYTQLRN